MQVGQQITDLQVNLGGLPATVSGQVVGADVAGAVLTVQVPVELLPPTAEPAHGRPQAAEAPPGRRTRRRGADKTVPIGSDGEFELTDIPSPAVYDLVRQQARVSPPTAARRPVRRARSRTDIQLRLRTGDGLISGTVTGPDGPLGGAVITATSGTTRWRRCR